MAVVWKLPHQINELLLPKCSLNIQDLRIRDPDLIHKFESVGIFLLKFAKFVIWFVITFLVKFLTTSQQLALRNKKLQKLDNLNYC